MNFFMHTDATKMKIDTHTDLTKINYFDLMDLARKYRRKSIDPNNLRQYQHTLLAMRIEGEIDSRNRRNNR